MKLQASLRGGDTVQMGRCFAGGSVQLIAEKKFMFTVIGCGIVPVRWMELRKEELRC